MGNRWGQGKGMGRERGEGQYTSNLGPEWTGIAPHAKEGFQVSRRDLGTGEGLFRQGGIIKGITKGIVPCASDIMPTCTYHANRVYVVLIKNCV
jgi:hypothetical protein